MLEDVPCADLPAVLETPDSVRDGEARARAIGGNRRRRLALTATMRTFSGRTVALLESRQSDELAGMVTRLGRHAGARAGGPRAARASDDVGPLLARHRRRVTSPMAVVLTGAGVTALFAEAERRGAPRGGAPGAGEHDDRLPGTEAAGRAQAARSERPVFQRPSRTRRASCSMRSPRRTATAVPSLLLHYGERNRALTAALTARGALVEDVCLYEWALPEDLAPLHDMVAPRGRRATIDALLVTSQIQFRHLLEIAGRAGLAEALVGALNEHVIVGAVGPVCAAALRAGGVVPDVMPASPNSASLRRRRGRLLRADRSPGGILNVTSTAARWPSADAHRLLRAFRRLLHALGARRCAGRVHLRWIWSRCGAQGLIVGVPILIGSLLRIPLGLLSDRLGGRRVGLALLAVSLRPAHDRLAGAGHICRY